MKYRIPRMNDEEFKRNLPNGYEFIPDGEGKDFDIKKEGNFYLLSDGRLTKNSKHLGKVENRTARWGYLVRRIMV